MARCSTSRPAPPHHLGSAKACAAAPLGVHKSPPRRRALAKHRTQNAKEQPLAHDVSDKPKVNGLAREQAVRKGAATSRGHNAGAGRPPKPKARRSHDSASRPSPVPGQGGHKPNAACANRTPAGRSPATLPGGAPLAWPAGADDRGPMDRTATGDCSHYEWVGEIGVGIEGGTRKREGGRW